MTPTKKQKLISEQAVYGDYIIMDIDENGFIQGWVFNQDSILDIIERDFNN